MATHSYSYTIAIIRTVNLISFTIGGTTYQAEEGMTWSQWCNSSYSANNYVIYNNEVQTSDHMNRINVLPSDTIVANTTYVLAHMGGGGN